MRRRVKGIWAALDVSEREVINQKITECLHSAPFWKQSESLLAYLAFGQEISLDPLIRLGLKEGKKVYVPRISKGGQMAFLRIHSLAEEELEYNTLNIREARRDAEAYNPALKGSARFTESGLRLGRGGGYYDRFLAQNKGFKTIGICWKGVLLSEIPTEGHDCPVDSLCCEGQLISCTGELGQGV